MENTRYFHDTIMSRQSCRDFMDEHVETEALVKVNKEYEAVDRLIPEIATEIRYVDYNRELLAGSVGYNGYSIKAPKYIVMMSDVKEHYLENAGYLAQALTLKLTELGIAACWLTVNDSEAVKKNLGFDSNMEVVTVIAIGYRNKESKEVRLDIVSPSNVTMTETKTQIAPKISLDSLLFDKTFGRPFNKGELYGELEDGLLAISHAQSFFNRQPYRVIVGDSDICLTGIEDGMTGEKDAHLNYGIVMFNFVAVLGSLRAKAPKWSFEAPDRDLKLPKEARFVARCKI